MIDYVHMSDEELIADLTRIDDTESEAEATQEFFTGQEIQYRPEKEQTKENCSKYSEHILRHKYSVHSFAELCRTPKPIKYLIDGYIQEGALHLDFGESESGKSFTVLDQGCCIACEEIDNWHGMRINQHGAVIIFAGEGATGMRKRCALWAYEHNVDPEKINLFIIDEVFHLDSTERDFSIENTIANIREISSQPVMVVFDTLNRFMEGDENKAVDAGRFITACTKIIKELSCAVRVISHVGNALENKGRVRGSSSILAAVDIATLYSKVEATPTEATISIDQTKNKEDQKRRGLKLSLRQKPLPPEWNYESGMASTSCILELSPYSTHDKPYAQQEQPQKKVSADYARGLRTFKKAVLKEGFIGKDKETGHTFAYVHVNCWRRVSHEMSSADTKSGQSKSFTRERRALFECDDPLLEKRIEEGIGEYYCINLDSDREKALTDELNANADSIYLSSYSDFSFIDSPTKTQD